jgi:CO/xanthine dehydrogenase Mo-binding subunit
VTQWGMTRWVGQRLRRHEDPALLQGLGRYTADFAAGARALRFVRSPVARGRILKVGAPAGATVITAGDLVEVKPICARLDRPDFVAVAQPILADARVTYVGEPVAAVIADGVAAAEDLAEEVALDIAAEPPVVTLDEALTAGSPLVHAPQPTTRCSTPASRTAAATERRWRPPPRLSTSPPFAPDSRRRGPRAAISALACRCFPSAPALAALPLPCAGWRSRRASRVELAMDPSGFVEVRIGSSPHGQGLETSLAQLIADEVGVTPDEIRVVCGDTDRTAYGWGTFASRSLVIAGGAAKLAAGKLRGQLKEVAAQVLEAAQADIELGGGSAAVRGTDLGIGIPRLARAAYHQSHRFPTIADTGLSAVASYDPYRTFSNACHIAIVAVDTGTGAVAMERFIVVEDAGLLINPMIVEGQIASGVAQGIANALYEAVVYDEGGNPLTASLADYLVLTMAEIPELEIHHLATLT